MNSRYAMIDRMLRQWVAEIEDAGLLQSWRTLVVERVMQLDGSRELTSEQLLDGLRRCPPGAPLYAMKRVKLSDGQLYPVVYFHRWQPRKKILWVTATRDPHSPYRALRLTDVHFHQLARTELAVRRRSPVSALPGPAYDTSPPGQVDLDDIPF